MHRRLRALGRFRDGVGGFHRRRRSGRATRKLLDVPAEGLCGELQSFDHRQVGEQLAVVRIVPYSSTESSGMEKKLENLTIGSFAKTAGVNVETIRFY